MFVEITNLIKKWQEGNIEARNQLFDQVNNELRQIAVSKLHQFNNEVLLQPTLLVNETFIKMVNQQELNINDRKHFFAIAAIVIFQTICDYKRQEIALKRGGELQKVSFSGIELAVPNLEMDFIALEEALNELAKKDERAVNVFLLKNLLGLTIKEICETVNLSHSVVETDLRFAKAWLKNKLS